MEEKINYSLKILNDKLKEHNILLSNDNINDIFTLIKYIFIIDDAFDNQQKKVVNLNNLNSRLHSVVDEIF
jgi:hypothetical protein